MRMEMVVVMKIKINRRRRIRVQGNDHGNILVPVQILMRLISKK
jgi:hypothetical protein